MINDVIMREMGPQKGSGRPAERLCNNAPQPWRPGRASFM
jgi:hypothetical protein